MSDEGLRELPQIGELVNSTDAEPLHQRARRRFVVAALRESVDALRSHMAAEEGATYGADALREAAFQGAHQILDRQLSPSLRRAINATGIVLHTGLGRAPLCDDAVAALRDCAQAVPLEIVPETGERGSRHAHCEELLCILTGAEAAFAVNNNAAACLLALDSLARGREVIVSRGQLVEIGGSFRMPDVVEKSGARLVEVGTTNRTYVRDYEAAITDETAAILDVHTSNYRIRGFTEQPDLRDLGELAHSHGLSFIFDAGSGALFDTARMGLPGEPVVGDAVQAGCDVVCFSGDKLLGGPQAGIAVGRAEKIDRMRKDPLARAVRAGKLTLAALQATLRAYIRPADSPGALPTIQRIAEPVTSVRARAGKVATALMDVNGVTAETVACTAQAGSGSLPDQEVASAGVTVRADGFRPDALARALRLATPAVYGRVSNNAVLLDLRTVPPDEVEELISVVVNVLRDAIGPGGE